MAVVSALAGCGGRSGASGSTGGTGGGAASALVEFAPADREAAPTIAGELLDGGHYDLASARGTVVVLNFWASWCSPCRVEAADLETVHQATKATGVTFLGIDIRDDRDKARAFHAGRTTYPSIFDPAGRLALDFDVPPNTIPATLIIDRAGRLAAVIRTSVRQADLQPIVERLAAEPGSTSVGSGASPDGGSGGGSSRGPAGGSNGGPDGGSSGGPGGGSGGGSDGGSGGGGPG